MRRTRKQIFDDAVALLEQASELYDKAEQELNRIGVELHCGDRPIELWYGGGKMFSVYKGLKKIAEINGTEVLAGQPMYAPDKPEYMHTVVDGIVISSMEGRDA